MKEHDCSKCPEDIKAECVLVNKEKIDKFIAMVEKMKSIILQASEPIGIHGDKNVYHYFNELKAFIQAQMDLISSSDWISKEDIGLSNRIAKESYDKEMEFILSVRELNNVNPNSKKRE